LRLDDSNINTFLNFSYDDSFSFCLGNSFSSIHFVLNSIRSWTSDIRFFLSAKILRIFTNKQVLKIKNIFFEFLDDNLLWFELEKMIRSGNINFASEYVYKSLNLFSYSPLSRFLLQIYLLELDIFFVRLISDFNIVKSLLGLFKKDVSYDFINLSSNYSPIKLEFLFNCGLQCHHY
jgi:hypothetical protein